MIAGLEEISSGQITIGDTVVNDVPPKDRDIAMVFQNYALYPHMSVFENMAFGLKLRKFPKSQIKDRVSETAKLLNIEQLLDRKPKALSGGQRQRVALGRAIVRNPKAFLFVEPLSNLDAKLRVTTRAELKALHHRLKTTSIYVTHDQAEAMTLGDRICLMYNGDVQQVAAPIEIFEKPVNRFVAGFLGTPPMNFFPGRLEYQNDNFIFVMMNDSVILPDRFKSLERNYNSRELVLGIRPEGISLNQYQGLNENSIKAAVLVVEPLGDRTDAYFSNSANPRFIANLEPHTPVKAQDHVRLYLNLNKAHLFEPGDTGKNLCVQ
jgi:multiple sugar transport system ATP-binding protein